MRFIIMHKNDPATEAGQPPPMEVVQRMGAFIGEHVKAGRFLGGDGLRGSAKRTRLTFRDGACTIKHGPYKGEHELPSTILTLKVRTRDEAIGWAQRYGKLLGDCEIELGTVTEAWDLGFMPKPEDAPLRMLLIEKSDAATESGRGRTPKQKADLTRLKTEMTKAGVLLASESLEPSSKSKRLLFKNNELVVMDGPFAETKELIGGFAMLRLSEIDEAIELCKEYAAILGGTLEIDVRPVLEPDAAAADVAHLDATPVGGA